MMDYAAFVEVAVGLNDEFVEAGGAAEVEGVAGLNDQFAEVEGAAEVGGAASDDEFAEVEVGVE